MSACLFQRGLKRAGAFYRKNETFGLMILSWIRGKQFFKISLLQHFLIRWAEGILIELIGCDPGKGRMFFSCQRALLNGRFEKVQMEILIWQCHIRKIKRLTDEHAQFFLAFAN